MRKLALAAAALLGLTSAGDAAYFQGQTYSVSAVPQITCDLATGTASVGGPCTTPPALGVCNGDLQVVTRTITLSTGTGGFKYLNTSVDTFTAADQGKLLVVNPHSTTGLNNDSAYIATVTDARNVVLATTAPSGVGPVSATLSIGTDDAPLFKQFNTWARANQGSTNQAVLNVPTNGNCWFGTQQAISVSGGGNNFYFAGLNNVLVEGNNSTWSSEDGGNGAGFDWSAGQQCHRGLTQSDGCSARIKTVLAGASTIELTADSYNAGYISRFSATPGVQGNWIMVGGLDTQTLWMGLYGYPSNPVYYEWRQITSICNNTGACPGTATLTLDRPLTNTLYDTWPLYNSGGVGEADPGGPATIWGYPSGWNSTAEFKNINVKQVNQTNANRRYVTIRNILTGSLTGAGVIPSQNEYFSSYGGAFVDIEVDKIIANVLYDGMTTGIMKCQSNSVGNMIIRNSTFTNQLAGCGRYTEVSDSTFKSLYLGATSYGGSTTFKCLRCSVATFNYATGIFQGGSKLADYTMSGGVLQFPNTGASGSDVDQRIFGPLPGNLFYMVGGSFSGSIGLVRPQSMTQDATNTYIQTNESGGLPTWSGGLSGYRVHPAPQFTNDDPVVGSDPVFLATSVQRGATPLAPVCQFSSATYTPSATGAQSRLCSMGKIVNLTIDVTVAGTTASGAFTMNPTAQFNQQTVKQSDWTAYNWLPTINLKAPGKREYTNSGSGTGAWTCDTGGGPVAGGCSGDTVTGAGLPPEQVWIKDSLVPFVNAGGTVTGTPTVKVSIQTDQGVVP